MTDQLKEWIVPLIGRRNTIDEHGSDELDFDTIVIKKSQGIVDGYDLYRAAKDVVKFIEGLETGRISTEKHQGPRLRFVSVEVDFDRGLVFTWD